LIEEALRHSSYVNEQNVPGLRDNERFEFLGDAVLNLVIGHLLMARYPQLREGHLSRIRASLVNETRLAALALNMDLGVYMRLGKGELQTNGQEKSSILADAFEALIAAVYLDAGFETAYCFVERQFASVFDTLDVPMIGQDFKSRLQEMVQGSFKTIPRYTVVGESGPDHDKTFKVCLQVHGIRTEGEGKSKKTAEQEAARKAIELLASE